ncbi:MAG: YraN family protein [Salibaculum sp.]|uniref:YraN family protein n=1 Tax=Salibaculum sp. TaxID=2855480 RepID=UPI002870AE86|nr:YraN family protein [Salibaculum sp.]MDR9482170.1 YraN family protein [Salibaculum sp.]
MRGLTAFHSGIAAEHCVERHYERRGCEVLARRWRSASGEVDLIARSGPQTVFIEVKKARDHAQAAARIAPAQARRIMDAALEYLDQAGAGADSDMRFDVALVDGTGRVRVVENAFLV